MFKLKPHSFYTTRFCNPEEVHKMAITSKRIKFDVEYKQKVLESTTTIFDVNDDCLAEIFSLLNLKDLLSVRATVSRFKTPSETAFLRLHRGRAACVSNRGGSLPISIDTLKRFGHLIKTLCVHFIMDKFEILMQAIVEHCGDTVTRLNFSHKREEWYCGLHRTAVRRTKRQFLGLKTKFPKLNSLTFEYNEWVECPYSDDIIQAIPTLTSFGASGIIFSHEDVYKLIALNGQLENLDFWVPNGYATQSFFDQLDASLPKLKTLELNHVTIEGTLDNSMLNPMRFKNLRKLVFGRVSTAYVVSGLPSLFGLEIEELELYSDNYFIANFIQSIRQFKKLTQFALNMFGNTQMLSTDALDTSIVSADGMKELILGNSQLEKILLTLHHKLDNFLIYGNGYSNVVKEKLNGSQWYVAKDEWCTKMKLMHITIEKK